MKTTSARNLVLVIGFLAVIIVIVVGGLMGGEFLLRHFQQMEASRTPDSAEVSELIAGFAAIGESTKSIDAKVTCESSPDNRVVAAAGIEGVASEIERLVVRAQALLDTKRELSPKDRSMLAGWISTGRSLAPPMKEAAKVLRSCNGSRTGDPKI